MQPESRMVASSNNIKMEEQPFIRVDLLHNAVLMQRIAHIGLDKRTVIFTSKNSVASVVNMLQDKQPKWDVYSLEGATMQAIQQYFTQVTIKQIARTAIDLVNIIDVNAANDPVVFFCGDKRMDTIPEVIKSKGVDLEEVIVYQTLHTPSVILKKYDGILFFSKSAVESFASANKLPVDTTLFAIGGTTAKALRDYAGDTLSIIQSPDPSERTLMKTIIDFYNDEE
ncbi:MAG: uroporphyrinogen-III synthase [Taibaiella sp.]|jgi:uroporphyrinogen-III synthase